jgi:hypothetical protein
MLILSFTTVRNRHNIFLWYISWLLFSVIHTFLHFMNIISLFWCNTAYLKEPAVISISPVQNTLFTVHFHFARNDVVTI